MKWEGMVEGRLMIYDSNIEYTIYMHGHGVNCGRNRDTHILDISLLTPLLLIFGFVALRR